MKTAGIIAEYDPFHNGHQYHIEETKRRTGAERVVVVMSGDFVQRGAPAIADKYLRAETALTAGADLVIELPVRYAAGSAEYFAAGAVSLLESLGVVDVLSFGSECGDVGTLQSAAEILAYESVPYQTALRDCLRQGLSFPAARAEALAACGYPDSVLKALENPNDILGIEYCKSLQKLGSHIQPAAIPRAGSGYHDRTLDGMYSSASALRHALRTDGIRSIADQIPPEAFRLLSDYLDTYGMIGIDDYSLLLRYRLMLESPGSVQRYLDVSEDLANRIFARLNEFAGFRQFTKLLQSRELTRARISRSLLHILLGIEQYRLSDKADENTPYARILGFQRESKNLLTAIKKEGKIPLISKLADRTTLLSGRALAMLDEDIWCANLYASVLAQKTGRPFVHEASRKIIVV